MKKILGSILVFVSSYMATSYIITKYFSEEAYKERTKQIYMDIIKATGQSQNNVPLFIEDSEEENAYTNGKKVVIYMGLINNADSWDEIALVLAHEVAHINLGHIQETPPVIMHAGMGENDIVEQLEANADKMGAVYMMKAGYNVCTGRKLFKRWLDASGNSTGEDHPNFSYRYDELNINCD